MLGVSFLKLFCNHFLLKIGSSLFSCDGLKRIKFQENDCRYLLHSYQNQKQLILNGVDKATYLFLKIIYVNTNQYLILQCIMVVCAFSVLF